MLDTFPNYVWNFQFPADSSKLPQCFVDFNTRAQGSFLKMHKFCTQVSVIFNYNYTVQKDRIF